MQIENVTIDCNDKVANANLIIMDRSCFIWLGNANDQPALGSLVSAIETKFGVLSSSLLGGDDERGSGLAQRLSRKFKIQTFVSYNLPESFDEEKLGVERKLVELLKVHFEVPERIESI